MNQLLFEGKSVRLKPFESETESGFWEKWDRDSEYRRQLDLMPAGLSCASLAREFFENHSSDGALFMIQTIPDAQVIGFVELDGIDWSARNGWVGIGLGERDYRGKGYGTEAMQLLLRYAFWGLNLHRVNLDVFSFNERAIRSYEKCGFRYEGTEREVLFKEDKRFDMISMGILREEWERLQESQDENLDVA